MRSNKLLLIAYLFLLTSAALAFPIKGTVIDRETKEPIPYVNIGVVGQSKGTVADENGKFSLEIQTASGTDVLRMSSIGYGSWEKSLADLQKECGSDCDLTVALTKATVDLKEITITANKLSTKVYGGTDENTMMASTFNLMGRPISENLGREIGIEVNNKKYPARVKNINMYLSQNTFDTLRFRVNIYGLNGKEIGPKLLSKDVVFKVANRKTGWVNFDLTPYDIVVEEGFLASLEWIGYYPEQENGRIFIPHAYPSFQSTYYRSTSQSSWEKKSGNVSINLTLEY